MTENKVLPKLRFSSFNEDWNKVVLGNLANSISSGKSKCEESGSFDVYGSTGKIGVCSNYSHQGKYILVARVGANAGLLNFVQGSFGVTDNTLVLDLKDTSSIRFIFYCLLSFNLNRLVFGSGQPLITGGQLKKLKFYLPLLPELQKIASFLDSVDEKLQQLTKKKELLSAYKKGIMQKIFSQELRFKDDNGNNYPDWEEKKLGEELEHKSIRNKSNQINLVLSVNNKRGFISQKEQFDGHQVASKDVTNYKVVNNGEYAYNPSRINIGSIARLDNFEQGIVSPMYVIFRLKNNLNPLFFDALYSSHRFKYLIKIGCSGSVRDSLNFDEMEKFVVKLPSLEEQQKIATFLSSLDSKIDLVNNQIDKTKVFKKGLLQQMFV